MLARKKGGVRMDLDPDFGLENPGRTYVVRRQEDWPVNILFNANKDFVAIDKDKYDENMQRIFDFVIPEPNDFTRRGPKEALPPDRPYEALKVIKIEPVLDFALLSLNEKKPKCSTVEVKQEVPVFHNAKDVDVIELSDEEREEDDDIMYVGEVVKTDNKVSASVAQTRKLKKKMDKLSSFLKEKGIEEINFGKVETEKEDDGFYVAEFLAGLDDQYLKVSCQEKRRKATFMLRPNESTYIANMIDPPKATKKAEKRKEKEEKKRVKKGDFSRPIRSPSPIIHVDVSSDDDAPLATKKKTEPNTKKQSPAAAPKRAFGKYARKTEDETPKVAPAAHELFVPRKEPKLKTLSLNEYMRTNDAKRQKETLAKMKKDRKDKEDEVRILEVKKKKKKDEDSSRVDSDKFKIPRLPPSKTSLGEPAKKKVRVVPSSELPVDILGTITEAMGARVPAKATSSSNTSPSKRADQYVLPRSYEEPIVIPSLPPRFGVKASYDEDDMDISSPEDSPRAPAEKTVSPASNDEGIELERRARLEVGVSPTAGRGDGVILKNREDPLNLDPMDTGSLYSSESLFDAANEAAELAKSLARYRLMQVDNLVIPARRSSNEIVLTETPLPPERLIPLARNGETSDPRVPAPSPGSLSRWQNTRVELDLNGEDPRLEVASKEKEEEDAKKKKKKGVKWGETATKEFDPNDDEEERPIEVVELEKKSDEPQQEVVGEKEVGGRKYKIVKKVKASEPAVPTVPAAPVVPVMPQSCLKPVPLPPPSHSLFPSGLFPPGVATRPGIPPPRTPPIEEYEGEDDDPFVIPIQPAAPRSVRIAPLTNLKIGAPARLPDFVPPRDEEKERREKEERERREKEERDRREKEEREKKERREREEREKREQEERRKKKESFYPEEMAGTSSSKMRGSADTGRNQGPSSSLSMGNVAMASSSLPSLGGAASSVSLNAVKPARRAFEKGSEIVGERPPMPAHKEEDVRYLLETRSKMAYQLQAHKTIRDEHKEYPANSRYPSMEEQLVEQRTYDYRLTSIEKDWKEDAIQPVWLQALPYQAHFNFERKAGLPWPVVQATDRIDENDKYFASQDVVRSLGNHTHFATEKKTLMGIETRLPNGMTHKERVEAALRGLQDPSKKPEGRFKNRRMHSRVFSTQSEDEARVIHNERMEEERRLLREHEDTMKKNAPQGVSIEQCRMTIERPTGFRDFNNMIQYYKNDDYETDQPFENPDWYCNKADYYSPYTERANYLCHLINHHNKDYNDLYEAPCYNKMELMITLDKAAFAASQIALGRMEGWKRVGVPEESYVVMMRRNQERRALIESSQSSPFSLAKYGELAKLDKVELPYFHFIIDWLSSIFKNIKPISEWGLQKALDTAFKEVIMTSKKKDRRGDPRDAREVFYEAFKVVTTTRPPDPKRSRNSRDDDY